MIYNNYADKTYFCGRNASYKKADAICRRVKREFPVFSSEKTARYGNIKENQHLRNIFYYLCDITSEFKEYIKEKKSKKANFYREILGMKKNKLGTSNEMADVTLMALKMNGYKNPKKVDLYAYNPVKHRIRNLKHTTVITDYQKPEGYKPFNPKKDRHMRSKHLLFPEKLENKRDIMFVDSLSGFADYSQTAKEKYRYDKMSSFKLEPEERIGFVIQDEVNLTKKDMNYLSRVFPSLKMENPIDTQGEKTVKKGLTTREINKYRYDHNIKSKASSRRHHHEHVLHPPKETRMERFIEKIKSIFS